MWALRILFANASAPDDVSATANPVSFAFIGNEHVAEDHVMSCASEDRPELGAHQFRTEDADAHVYNLRVTHVS